MTDSMKPVSVVQGISQLLSILLFLLTCCTLYPAELRTARAKKIDRYCRVIVPVVFVIASIVIFAYPRG
jgi:hypothetical protein